jgi:hypothetical protein
VDVKEKKRVNYLSKNRNKRKEEAEEDLDRI